MDSTERLVRGQKVVDVGSPIRVPVGPGTLGRIINVIGEPIDERGPVDTQQWVDWRLFVKMTNFSDIRAVIWEEIFKPEENCMVLANLPYL